MNTMPIYEPSSGTLREAPIPEAGEMYIKDTVWNNAFPEVMLVLKYPAATYRRFKSDELDHTVRILCMESGKIQEYDDILMVYYSQINTDRPRNDKV